jgi:hypothetical protein
MEGFLKDLNSTSNSNNSSSNNINSNNIDSNNNNVAVAYFHVPVLVKRERYQVFHRFGQVKFSYRYGGLVLGSSQILLLPQLPQNDTQFKNDNRLKNNLH